MYIYHFTFHFTFDFPFIFLPFFPQIPSPRKNVPKCERLVFTLPPHQDGGGEGSDIFRHIDPILVVQRSYLSSLLVMVMSFNMNLSHAVCELTIQALFGPSSKNWWERLQVLSTSCWPWSDVGASIPAPASDWGPAAKTPWTSRSFPASPRRRGWRPAALLPASLKIARARTWPLSSKTFLELYLLRNESGLHVQNDWPQKRAPETMPPGKTIISSPPVVAYVDISSS